MASASCHPPLSLFIQGDYVAQVNLELQLWVLGSQAWLHPLFEKAPVVEASEAPQLARSTPACLSDSAEVKNSDETAHSLVIWDWEMEGTYSLHSGLQWEHLVTVWNAGHRSSSQQVFRIGYCTREGDSLTYLTGKAARQKWAVTNALTRRDCTDTCWG